MYGVTTDAFFIFLFLSYVVVVMEGLFISFFILYYRKDLDKNVRWIHIERNCCAPRNNCRNLPCPTRDRSFQKVGRLGLRSMFPLLPCNSHTIGDYPDAIPPALSDWMECIHTWKQTCKEITSPSTPFVIPSSFFSFSLLSPHVFTFIFATIQCSRKWSKDFHWI